MNPNDVIGAPREIWVWVAPDWSDWREGEAKPANASGWTRAKIRETLYADGRIVRNVLDAKGLPVAADGTPATGENPARPLDSTPQYDKDQQARWKEQQNTAAPPGGQPTRNINGQTFQWNPSTRAYDIPIGQAPSTAQTAAPGGKPFIDDGAEARENGRRWGWNAETKLYDRDLGPSPTAQEIIRNRSLPADQDPRAETDAEREARAKETIAQQEREATRNTRVREPVKDRPGLYIVKETKDGRTETFYENEAGARVPAPTEAPKPVQGPNGQWGYWDNSATPPKWVAIQGGPGQATSMPTLVEGQWGYWKPGENGAAPTWTTVTGPSQPALPADAPQVDYSSPERAYDTLIQLSGWLGARVNSGKMTRAQAEAILATPHSTVKLMVERANNDRAQQQQQITNQLTQRAQDINQAGTRLGAANTQYQQALSHAEKINLLADPGTNAAANTLIGNLALQAIHAQQMGGMATPASVVVPGPVANLPPYTPTLPSPAAVGTPPGALIPGMIAPPGPPPGGAVTTTPAPPAAVDPRSIGAPEAPAGGAVPVAAPPANLGYGPAPAQTEYVRVRLPSGLHITRTSREWARAEGWNPGAVVVETQTAAAPPWPDDPIGAPQAGGAAPAAATLPPPVPMPEIAPQAPHLPPPVPMPEPAPQAPHLPPPVPMPDIGSQVPFGMPTMALASTFGGRPAYDDVRASMRAMGLTDDVIDEAMRGFTSGSLG